MDNLAYLCLDHHDQYDSRRSQSKGFTVGEVKQYRSELRNIVQRFLDEQVGIGMMTLENRDPYAGHYVREDSDISWSAEIDLTTVPDTITGDIRYFVSGFALLGGHQRTGPRIGDLSFVAELRDGKLEHTFEASRQDAEPHRVTIEFTPSGFTLAEDNHFGAYGFGVSFAGDFERAEKLDYSNWYWQNDDARRLFNSPHNVSFLPDDGPPEEG
ncbi:hypothetical protein QH494_08010 [Sphingomonas sp. AR_OL41]|uniref:hypothetical protein n=1 Tax=Sphingomonas sp. AR_OL41 TaxID=3042729 RepID=UPI0024811C06|nr:hypothetical protein [Sphingomonas sp. AR_OL41]MDH7972128.1 hypothetical protein [Sphingomonas sp. AR_OL41]